VSRKSKSTGKQPIFGSMPGSALRAFLKSAVPVELRAREVLFHAGDTGAGCYYLRSGAAKAAVIAKDGQERLLAVLGPGSLIGELSLFDDQPRSATVSALRPCKLMHLTKASFFQLADNNPSIYRLSLKLLTERLRGTNDSVVAQGTVTVLGRVARALETLAEGVGEADSTGRIVFAQKITQTDIAGMAGVARENANRAIHELMRDGILSRVKGYYAIEKPEDLADLSEI
jgi:CRP/FNR family transcriptional regulator, cyclic AMP receptor protein